MRGPFGNKSQSMQDLISFHLQSLKARDIAGCQRLKLLGQELGQALGIHGRVGQ